MSFVTNFPQPQPLNINWGNWKDFSAEGLDLPYSKNNNQLEVDDDVEII